MSGREKLKKEIAGAVIFAAFGLSVEILVTGLPRLFKNSGKGFVSVLMVILYMIVYLTAPYIFRVLDRFNLKNRFVRALFLVLIIYAFEWSFGIVCRTFGFVPWDYRKMRSFHWLTNFSNGNIQLAFAPLWYVYAIVVEPLIKCIRIAVDSLVRKNIKFWKLTANDPGC